MTANAFKEDEHAALEAGMQAHIAKPVDVELLKKTPEGAVLEISIHEGRNRQVRRMCEQAGLAVTRLCRVREGALRLGSLRPGQWRFLTDEELRSIGVEP